MRHRLPRRVATALLAFIFLAPVLVAHRTYASARPAAPQNQHSVTLRWTPNGTSVAGYNAYRATLSGGPYTKLNSTLVKVALYVDMNVQAGQTYFYTVTAVNASQVESAKSNEAKATVPTP